MVQKMYRFKSCSTNVRDVLLGSLLIPSIATYPLFVPLHKHIAMVSGHMATVSIGIGCIIYTGLIPLFLYREN